MFRTGFRGGPEFFTFLNSITKVGICDDRSKLAPQPAVNYIIKFEPAHSNLFCVSALGRYEYRLPGGGRGYSSRHK